MERQKAATAGELGGAGPAGGGGEEQALVEGGPPSGSLYLPS